MRRLILVLLCFAPQPSAHAAGSSELVHPYPPSGPAEVAGTPVSGKVLRTMQQHAVPAFTDVLAQHVAHTLQGASHHAVSVARKPRQGGHEAAAAVASAAADGRTLLLASAMPAGPRLQPVAIVATMPSVFVTGASQRTSLNDEIRDVVRDLIRPAGRRLFVASAGERSAGHLALERLRLDRGSPVEPVAYNGGVAALHAVATRELSTALVPLPAAVPYLGGGRIRVLAVAEPRRHPAIPETPTTAQAGLGDFRATGWFGLFAPAATPDSAIHEINARAARIAEAEDARRLFLELGVRLEHRAHE